MDESLAQRLTFIVLRDTAGREVRLGSLWATKPAVLVFLRHFGCIFCREHVVQLLKYETAFRAKGATLAAVGLGGAGYANEFRSEFGITFPLLIDEERRAYEIAELRSASPFAVFTNDFVESWKRAKNAGHRQDRFLARNPFQLGGSFVFGPGEVQFFAHYSQSFGDNASPESLLAAIP